MKPIISQNTRIRYPELFSIEDDSIVDDFSYLSTNIKVGHHSHLAANITIGGGPTYRFELGDFSTICSGTRIYVSSGDFVRGLVTTSALRDHEIGGDVIFGNYTAVGCNSVVMPNNVIPEGTVIGALCFVPTNFPFEPWSVYAGTPLRRIGARDRMAVMAEVASIQ